MVSPRVPNPPPKPVGSFPAFVQAQHAKNDPEVQAKLPLGQRLLNAGLITTSQLAQALREQQQNRLKLGEVCLEHGWIKPEDLYKLTASRDLALGEILVLLGLIEFPQLRVALIQQRRYNRPLGEILVWKGWLTQELLEQVLHIQAYLRQLESDNAWEAWQSNEVSEILSSEESPVETEASQLSADPSAVAVPPHLMGSEAWASNGTGSEDESASEGFSQDQADPQVVAEISGAHRADPFATLSANLSALSQRLKPSQDSSQASMDPRARMDQADPGADPGVEASLSQPDESADWQLFEPLEPYSTSHDHTDLDAIEAAEDPQSRIAFLEYQLQVQHQEWEAYAESMQQQIAAYHIYYGERIEELETTVAQQTEQYEATTLADELEKQQLHLQVQQLEGEVRRSQAQIRQQATKLEAQATELDKNRADNARLRTDLIDAQSQVYTLEQALQSERAETQRLAHQLARQQSSDPNSQTPPPILDPHAPPNTQPPTTPALDGPTTLPDPQIYRAFQGSQASTSNTPVTLPDPQTYPHSTSESGSQPQPPSPPTLPDPQSLPVNHSPSNRETIGLTPIRLPQPNSALSGQSTASTQFRSTDPGEIDGLKQEDATAQTAILTPWARNLLFQLQDADLLSEAEIDTIVETLHTQEGKLTQVLFSQTTLKPATIKFFSENGKSAQQAGCQSLGDFLRAAGLVTDDQLQDILNSAQWGHRLGDLLVDRGILKPATVDYFLRRFARLNSDLI